MTIHDLFPEFDEKEAKEAEEVIRQYLDLAMRVYEHIRSEPEKYARFKRLTETRRGSSLKVQVFKGDPHLPTLV